MSAELAPYLQDKLEELERELEVRAWYGVDGAWAEHSRSDTRDQIPSATMPKARAYPVLQVLPGKYKTRSMADHLIPTGGRHYREGVRDKLHQPTSSSKIAPKL